MFAYIKGYLAADTKALRDEASQAARAWLVYKGYGKGGHWTDAYRAQFTGFTRAYMNERRHAAGLDRMKAKG